MATSMKTICLKGQWLCAVALAFSAALVFPQEVSARLRVVTTLPSFADVAQSVGGDEVVVSPLIKGNQDPHFVDAKPDLILSLNKADLILHAGLGLEDGWLPPLLTGARNTKILAGAPGNLDVSSLMKLRDVPQGKLDRSQGDVHPGGSPHYMLDPRNGLVLARGIADRLAQLNPGKAALFQANAATYVRSLEAKIKVWKGGLVSMQGLPVVTYHRSWGYFLDWVGAKEFGTIEPKPGIPPSPSHVAELIGQMKQKKVKLILIEPFYPAGSAEQVAGATGAKLLILPTEVRAMPEAETYFGVFDTIVARIKSAL